MQKVLIIPVSALLVLLSITALIALGDEPPVSYNLPLVTSGPPIALLAANVSSASVEPPNPPLFVYAGTTPPPGVYRATLDRMWVLVPRPMDKGMVIGVVEPERFNMPVMKPETKLEPILQAYNALELKAK